MVAANLYQEKYTTRYYSEERWYCSCREATKKNKQTENQSSEDFRILSKRRASIFCVKYRKRCLCPLIALAYLGVAIELYTTKVLNDAKVSIGPKHCKSSGAYYLLVLTGSRNQLAVSLNGLE